MHENTDVNQGKPEEFIPASLVKRYNRFWNGRNSTIHPSSACCIANT